MEASQRAHSVHRTASELIELHVFVAVYEAGTFSGAARRLGISLPSISRHIAKLETSLGTKLIQRTTRSLSITGAGETFYQRSREVLAALEAAETEVTDHSKAPRGRVTVASTNGFAMRFLKAHLSEFMRRYPDVTIEFMLTSEKVDMLREGIDLSIFASNDLGINATPGFTATLLTNLPTGIFASPKYAAEFGLPETPEDLVHHNCLCGRTDTFNSLWPIKDGSKVRFVRVQGSLVVDNAEIILEIARNGLGIALLPLYSALPLCEKGELIEVLKGQVGQTNAVHAIVPNRKYMAKATRVFIDFVRECLTAQEEVLGLAAKGESNGVPNGIGRAGAVPGKLFDSVVQGQQKCLS